MDGLGEFFAMGGYAPYVWGAYGLAAIVLVGLLVATLKRLRESEATLRALEQARPPRRARPGRRPAPAETDGTDDA